MSGALSAGTVSLGVKPETKGFGAKLSEGILGESAGLGALGSHLGGMLLAGLGAVGIAVGVGEFIKKGVEEYSTADALNAQFAAGITSTKNAANLSVKGMDQLAASIAGYSGQSYASIGKTEQVLQTFTKLKNVGPNKIFDDATTAAANMAAKLGGDASGSAIQLGKALNDPVKGMTALRRVGVAFTAAQTAQVKAMVASGNVMGAQKVILGELNTEFGGAAKAAGETLPGELARSKVAFGELTKAVLSGVMPFVTPVIAGIADAMNKATPFIEAFAEKFKGVLEPAVEKTKNAFHQFATGFEEGTDAAGSSQSIFAVFGAVVFSVFDKVRNAFHDLVSGFTKGTDEIGSSQSIFAQWGAVLYTVFDGVRKTAKPIIDAIGAAFKQLWPSIQKLLPQFLKLAEAISPVHLIFKALAPVLPAIIGVLEKLAVTLAGALGKALGIVLPIVTKLSSMLAGELLKVVQMLIPVIIKLVDAIGPVLGRILIAVGPLIGMIATFIGQLLQAAMPLINVVLQLVMAFLPLLTPLIQLVGIILTPLIQLLTVLLQPIMALVQWLVSLLVPAIQLVAQIITWIVTNAIAGFKLELNSIVGVVHFLGDAIGTVFGTIGDIIKGAFNGVVDFVKGIFNTIDGIVNNIIDGVNGATSMAGAIGIHIGAIPHLPKLADGATVLPRPGGTIAVLAEAGKPESVVDTGKLNKLLDKATARPNAPGGIFNIYEAVSARATALQVNRIQASLGA